MKKIGMLVIVLFLMCRPMAVLAYSSNDTQSIANEAGATDFESPYLEDDEVSGDKHINIYQKLLDILSDTFKGNEKNILRSFGLILGMIVLCAVMNSMKFDNGGMDIAVGFISILVLSGVVYSVLYNLFIFVIASMQSLNLAMTSLMPVMAAINCAGGSVSASAASASAITFFLSVLSVISTNGILPMLRISFALCLSGAMPGSINLSSVTNLAKSTATTLLAFIFSALGFVLYIQTIIASAIDTFVLRTVRFASGTFVPVIGAMLGEASRTILASVSVIKGTVGSVGIVLVLSAVLPPFIVSVLYKLMLLLCAIIAKALGCDKESSFLYDIGGILGILIGLTAGAGAICIIALAMFIRIGVNV